MSKQWLAGLMEGEGTFSSSWKANRGTGNVSLSPNITLATKDKDVAKRAQEELSAIAGYNMPASVTERPGYPFYLVHTGKQEAVIKIIQALYSMMGLRRKKQMSVLYQRIEKFREYRRGDNADTRLLR